MIRFLTAGPDIAITDERYTEQKGSGHWSECLWLKDITSVFKI